MPDDITTTIYRIETNAVLMEAVARMHAESVADDPAAAPAPGWREQLGHVVRLYGREIVLATLIEAVPGLSVRQLMVMVDLAEKSPSGYLPALRG